ncbi:hypothetical protein KJ780_04440 [Candidatus Micrarchaeota archaeon]|nr:hypothetical protein [Candidatus Micrarchaeota archaeon]
MDLDKELGTDVKKLTKETVAKGGVLAMLYFDINSNNKEALQQLGAAFVQKLLKFEGVVYAVGEIEEPVGDEILFTTAVDVKVLTKNFASLARICSEHPPFSVEILEPAELMMDTYQAQNILMTVASNTYELKKFILEKVYRPEDMEKLKKAVSARTELGKKLMEKKG